MKPACAHDAHPRSALAVEAIGHIAVHAARLAATLSQGDGAKVVPTDPWAEFDRFTMLRALYVSERALIDFVLGDPVLRWCHHPQLAGGSGRYRGRDEECPTCGVATRVSDDVTPGCFLPEASATFPFGSTKVTTVDKLKKALHDRGKRVNKQIAHLTWTAIDSPRSWTYEKNENVIDALECFREALDAVGSPDADLFGTRLDEARSATA